MSVAVTSFFDVIRLKVVTKIVINNETKKGHKYVVDYQNLNILQNGLYRKNFELQSYIVINIILPRNGRYLKDFRH